MTPSSQKAIQSSTKWKKNGAEERDAKSRGSTTCTKSRRLMLISLIEERRLQDLYVDKNKTVADYTVCWWWKNSWNLLCIFVWIKYLDGVYLYPQHPTCLMLSDDGVFRYCVRSCVSLKQFFRFFFVFSPSVWRNPANLSLVIFLFCLWISLPSLYIITISLRTHNRYVVSKRKEKWFVLVFFLFWFVDCDECMCWLWVREAISLSSSIKSS